MSFSLCKSRLRICSCSQKIAKSGKAERSERRPREVFDGVNIFALAKSKQSKNTEPPVFQDFSDIMNV